MNATRAFRKAFRIQRYRERLSATTEAKLQVRDRQALVNALNEGLQRYANATPNPKSEDSLGISRADMPQIAGHDKKEFLDWLNSSYAIDSHSASRKISDLKFTQKDFNADKVRSMADKMRDDGIQPGSAILASSDGYVFDGHHRARAQLEVDPDSKVSLIVVDADIRELLGKAKKFPKSFTAGTDEDAGPRDYADKDREDYPSKQQRSMFEERQREMFSRVQGHLIRYGLLQYEQGRDAVGRFAPNYDSPARVYPPDKKKHWVPAASDKADVRGGSWSKDGSRFTHNSGDTENRYGADQKEYDDPCFGDGNECYREVERGQVDYGAGQWDESKHPRAADGKFGHGGGQAAVAEPTTPGQQQPESPASQTETAPESPREPQNQSADFSQIHRHYPPANPQGHDTQSKYLLPDGSYTPERQRLHHELVSKRLEGVTRSENPTVFMLGGGTASGKSTMVKQGSVSVPSNAAHVDPDEIKGEIPEYGAMTEARDTHAAAFSHEESSDVSKEVISRGLESGFDVVADTTGDNSLDKLRSKVKEWRQHGHRVVANYATVPTEMAFERANSRAQKTGRFVPASVIKGIHANVSKIVPQAVAEGLFDEFNLYDTSGGEPKRVASAAGNQLQIHDQALWDSFVAKGQV